MADPVEEADLGTAEEATEVETAESVEAETEDSVDAETEDADGDDSGAETDAQGKGVVKYSRFRNVNERRKAAEERVAELQAEVARLRPKDEKPQPKGLRERLKQDFKPAPSDLPVLDQMQFYGLQVMEQHFPELMEQWFEAKFGTKPEAAAATLAHSAVSTREQIVKQFTEAAEAHGLDPRDETLRSAVGVLLDTGRFRTFAEAMDVFGASKVKPQQKRPINGKGAESESVDITGLVRARNSILTKEQAMALAAKGQRVEHVSVVDILKSASKGA